MLAMLMSSGTAFADSLTGKVVDPQGLAVANATIVLFDRNSGEQRNTMSGEDGVYGFGDIPAGAYLLEADASGSALVVSQEVVVKGAQRLDVTLRVAGARSGVVVTASGTSQSITEVAKAVDMVDAEQMNLRDAFQITEAIRIVPGVQVQQSEGPGSFTTIQTRGLRTTDTAVLIDGMRFQDSGSPQNEASAFLGDLTPTDTERVEFMRGSGSSLYGSNAIAGVVNIVSRSGGGPTRGELRVEGGGLGLFRGVGGIGGGSERGNYSASVSHLNVIDGVRERSPYRNTSAQGSARFSLRPGMILTARVWSDSARAASTEAPTLTPALLANSPANGRVAAVPLPIDQLALFEQGQPFAAGNATYIPNQIDPDGQRRSSFISGTVTLQQLLSPATTYRIAYQAVDTRRGYRDGPEGPGPFDPPAAETGHFNGRTGTLQARLDQHFGRYTFLTAGYELVHEQYVSFTDTPSDPNETNGIDLSMRSHAFYAQDQIPLLGGRLQLNLSGRIQLFSLRQPVFSGIADNPYQSRIATIETPNAYTGDGSAAYFFASSQTKLRAHGGNSYRAPSAYERFGGGFGTYYGDPRLRPDRALALDGGVDQWLFHAKLQLSGTLFVTKLQEAIRFVNVLPADDPFERPFGGYANGGSGRARGVELSAHWSPTNKTAAQVSYTYTDSRADAPTVGTNYFKFLGLAPHAFALSATQWIAPRFRATVDLFTRSNYAMTISGGGNRLFDFNGTTKANVVLGYEMPMAGARKIELYTKIENLFNQVPYEDGNIGPGRWAVAGLRFKY
jgi:iron complex outermembrane receptor protein